MSKSGIYQILNIVTGKLYVGSAIKISLRWATHKWQLNYNIHDNRLLQHSWNKHGGKSFIFKVLEYCEKEKLIEREQTWINWTLCYDREFGYNLRKNANNMLGVKLSEETKRKMSAAQKGRIVSDEAKAKISFANKGFIHSEETKRKMSITRKGRKLSEEHLLKTLTFRRGSKHTVETRIKMSEAQIRNSKWPHEKGCKCKCEECREIKNKGQRDNRSKNKIVPFIMVNANV